MTEVVGAIDGKPSPKSVTGPLDRPLATGEGWSVREFTCRAGPGDRPFEERHDGASVALVIEGSFSYASSSGRALLYPGAVLLGNPGACYQCGHDHGVGDRCIAIQLSPTYFAELAATAAGSARYKFPTAMLPADRALLPAAAILQATCQAGETLRIEERAVGFVTAALRRLSGLRPAAQRVSALDERRVSRALRYIEENADASLDLDRLAGIAAMSKFHFLRVFRRAIGMTPYQFLLDRRLRRAALRLLRTADPVGAIAFDAGFGDLSTFNNGFRRRFGVSPSLYRRQARAI